MKAVLGFCVLLFSLSVHAQLGESLVKMEESYGKGSRAKEKWITPPFTNVYFFTRRELKIKACFIEDVCVFQALRPRSRANKSLPSSSVVAALADNTVEAKDTEKWTEVELKVVDPLVKSRYKLRKAWIRCDKKAWAHLTSLELTIFNQAYLDHASKAKETAGKEKQFRKLVGIVKGDDFKKSLIAVRDISKLGPDYIKQLPPLVSRLQKVNRRSITTVLGRLPKRDKAQEEALAKTRAAAMANIGKLSKQNLPDAHRYCKDLMRQTGVMTPRLAKMAKAMLSLQEYLKQDQQLLSVLGQLSRAGLVKLDKEAERKFAASLETSLGGTVAELINMPGPESKPPSNPFLKTIWRYNFNRRIEAYNKSRLKDRVATRDEYQNLYIVNEYRESLGLRRLELDERLVQSARQHSKEMVERKYFSHKSPVPEYATHKMRMRKSGYPSPGGENIAHGRSKPGEVFWMWFNSPPHHKTIARGHEKALGVGRWGVHWTQNFGRGPLLAFADQKTRDAAKPGRK